MFIAAVFIAIILGYVFKGSIKNLDTSKIRGIYLVFFAFFIEFAIVMLIRLGYLTRGTVTFSLDVIMYMLLLGFIYLNRYSRYMLLIGAGFILNAIAIFSNGGAMPVGIEAAKLMGFADNVNAEGLYTLVSSSTRIAFLGDIIYIKYPRAYAISIGDVIMAVGLILYIVTEMRNKRTIKILTVQR